MTADNLGFKKKLKLMAKNRAFRTAHKISVRRVKKIAENSSPVKSKKGGKKILFNLVYGMYGRLIFWETGLAKALQIRGHDVKVLMCGKSLTMCTSEFTSRSVHNEKTCDHCVNFSRDFLNAAGLPFIEYKDYLSDKEIKEITKKVNKLSIDECKKMVYKEIQVGPLSINAVMRYFEGDLKPDSKEYDRVLRMELINSIIAVDFAEKINKKEKPDIIVTTHLGYSSWGALADYFVLKGVRVVYPGDGYLENTLQFDFYIDERKENVFKKYFEQVRKKKLIDNKEDKELQTFLDKRMKGEEGDTTMYGFSNEDVSSQFNLDEYKKTFACFPNVAWDSSLLNSNRGFKDVYDWVDYTVGLFNDKPDYQLIVKIHPSEEYFAKSKNTVSDFIKSKYSPLPNNITIIPPDTKISPYALFSFIDVGLVYNGTVGLEMAINGLPVLAAGVTHYGDSGFTYDIFTKDEYKKLLFSDIKPLSKEKIKLARTYAYYFFIKSFLPYDIVYKNKFFDLQFKLDSFDELAEGKNKFIDMMCKYIISNGIYQNW